MSVRLPDREAAFVDRMVREGGFSGRAQYLSWLVAKAEQRARDVANLNRMRDSGSLRDPEVEAIVGGTAHQPLASLDE